ncbi:MAG: hypothetical protein M2R45_03954 [Verrucomicrobia subdivision 3 bacterium]|nr:hypothetical protein [Limisphaerales bacterium]MCS1415526.1 hypothetical protein [Limisphaerales bacterium]
MALHPARRLPWRPAKQSITYSHRYRHILPQSVFVGLSRLLGDPLPRGALLKQPLPVPLAGLAQSTHSRPTTLPPRIKSCGSRAVRTERAIEASRRHAGGFRSRPTLKGVAAGTLAYPFAIRLPFAPKGAFPWGPSNPTSASGIPPRLWPFLQRDGHRLRPWRPRDAPGINRIDLPRIALIAQPRAPPSSF